MRSPHNPLAEDITKWAYEGSAEEPVQDWDLVLSHTPHESLYMKLASSSDCPKQEYFLSVLYLIVGDAVRTHFRTRSHEDIQRLLSVAEQDFPQYCLHLWVQRAHDLLAKPETFRYDDWCAGQLARSYERQPRAAPNRRPPSQ